MSLRTGRVVMDEDYDLLRVDDSKRGARCPDFRGTMK